MGRIERGAQGDGRTSAARTTGGPASSAPRELALDDLLKALTHPWRLAPELTLPELTALPDYTPLQVQLLHNRSLRDEPAIRAWFARDWRAPEPSLPGLPEAVARIRRALSRGERIVVFGDFDADGVTSCAALLLALRALGAAVSPYIPQRDDAGRGPSEAALRDLRERGTDLVITTDNGTTNAAEVAFAAGLGMAVIVTDHHAPQGPLAPAVAIVNPRLAPNPGPDADLAGVGVAFRLAEALLAATPEGDAVLESLLDLVAIGTIADIAPLSGANWALVRAGLARLNARPRPGLRALIAQVGLAPGALNEGDISYRIAPRLNAGQRMGEPQLALDLLLTDDPREAERLAARLATLNSARQRQTDELLDEARAQLQVRPPAPESRLVVVQGNAWPLGMLGLVAGRLADEHDRAALAIGREGEHCRGSLRGPDGVNVVAALAAASDLLAHFGGHARAAGFTVAASNLEPLLARLRAFLSVADRPDGADQDAPGTQMMVDCRLPLARVTRAKYRELRALGPFGLGFAEPRFLARGSRIVRCFPAGPGLRHLRLVLRDGTGERLASWPHKGHYAESLAHQLSALPPLDVVYSFAPFYVSGAVEYVCVDALSLPA